MTLVYKVQSSKSLTNKIKTNKCVLCRISINNIVAFCTSADVEINGDFSNHVYVCDLVTPWQNYMLCSSKNIVSVLEWNYNGDLLLVGYKGGIIEIWFTKHQLLNSWDLLCSTSLSNEDIINCKFFHNGENIFFHSQRRDSSSYAEKFERVEYKPTLTKFGNAPIEGGVAITASGMLAVFVIPKLSHQGDHSLNRPGTCLTTVTHSIALSRSFISASCMTHCSNGTMNIAINSNLHKQLIQCFKVTLKMETDENIFIKCESIPSIFLSNKYKKIRHLRWTTINNEDVIFAVYESVEGALEQWNLMNNHKNVHKMLQKNKSDVIQYESWESKATLCFTNPIVDICISKLSSDSTKIFAILNNNTVQVLEPGLKKGASTVFENYDDLKLQRYLSADISPLDQIMIVFDNFGQMYGLQVPNAYVDKSAKIITASMLISLLEYCIITGIDPSDILMLNLVNLDMLIEKLTENFMRQPTFTKQFYYSNFLSLKSNIYRIQSKQEDFDNLVMLHTISITFKSLLRPADLSSQDKGPADILAIILAEPLTDVDKVLLNLDPKDFTVEPWTLQSLQQLIQWVADLALNILNKLPDEVMKMKLNKRQGYDLSRDAAAIGSIRELLVMIRIWGLLNSNCLPIYTKSVDNVDVLSVLFRLLTRLAQNINEPDEALLDECSVLSTQVLVPQRRFNNPTTMLNCQVSNVKTFPFIFTRANEPLGFQDIQMEEVIFASGTKDGVTNLQLGSKADPIRRCVRCGFVNNLQKMVKTSAVKAWSHRWIRCHCGGYWKI